MNEKILNMGFKSKFSQRHSLYVVKVEKLNGEEDSENSKWIALLNLNETMIYQRKTLNLNGHLIDVEERLR